MEEPSRYLGLFRFFGVTLAMVVIAALPMHARAALFFGSDADAKETTYTITAVKTSPAVTGWDLFAPETLGVFLDAFTNADIAPSAEALLVPCSDDRDCILLSANTRSVVKGLFSFWTTPPTLAVDSESADELAAFADTVCDGATRLSVVAQTVTATDLVTAPANKVRCTITHATNPFSAILFTITVRGTFPASTPQ